MSRFQGPLPGAARPNPGASVVGAWRAVVEGLTPLQVSVPALTGLGVRIGKVEVSWEPISTVPLAVGDRVWVMCIEGVPTDLLIFGRR